MYKGYMMITGEGGQGTKSQNSVLDLDATLLP